MSAREQFAAALPATAPESIFRTSMAVPIAAVERNQPKRRPEQRRTAQRRVLPGFGLTLGYTMVYLSLLVLIPLSAVFIRSLGLGWGHFWEVVTAPRVAASLRLSFGASLIAALINAIFGLIVAWVLVRYTFPFKRLIDAMVDLPFALPTAVAGIALAALYAPNGWLGMWLKSAGIQVAFTPLGIVVALTFIGLPFVVRTLQPVLEDLDREVEQAAATLGASPAQAFARVILPSLWPALLTGFALSFARAVGEYGSVIFIAGNMPMKSEIAPLLIVTKLEQYDYAGATAIAAVMLVLSFTLMLGINALQHWALKRHGGR
jgi:sulfate/thiosulfate transport system permease protein